MQNGEISKQACTDWTNYVREVCCAVLQRLLFTKVARWVVLSRVYQAPADDGTRTGWSLSRTRQTWRVHRTSETATWLSLCW
ncbi:hypothetical protein V5799_005777 [Amblyomma americanum]|uniref:Uncharacterized protein n=1 Tax=Amblyomma americanum TaxID=6943 RepID=A0AAQ4DYA7_AMBAM